MASARKSLALRWLSIVGFGSAVAAVPALSNHPIADEAVGPREPAFDRQDEVKALAGVWQRYENFAEGELIRFYYFHGDGHGLYRYGRLGHTNTNSFTYDVRGKRLLLRFKKTGEEYSVPFARERDSQGREWLVLVDDPRDEGETRYLRESTEPVGRPAALAEPGPPPAGHMWIDFREYATGGRGFHFYQFRPAGIDGRGVGWYHRGDFHDWSTESLAYRITGNKIEFWFPLVGQKFVTAFSIEAGARGRVLKLEEDPRDYWHPHALEDAGPSFGGTWARYGWAFEGDLPDR